MLNLEGLDVSGKLIALEGESEIISTHIRLLPPSHKILVFPTSQDHICKADDLEEFDPKSFIRNVHATFTQRLNVANTFLKASEPNHPRLVFMNGGSIRARTICIEGICNNLTSGDIGAAESIFNDLIKDGLAGLIENKMNFPDQDSIDKLVEDVSIHKEGKINNGNDGKTSNSSSKDGNGLEMKSIEKKYLDEESGHSINNSSSLGTTNLRREPITTNFSNNILLPHELSDNQNVQIKKMIPVNGDKIVRTTFTLAPKEPTTPSRTQTPIESQRCLTPSKSIPSIPGAYLQDPKDDFKRNSLVLDFTINDMSFPSTPTTAIFASPNFFDETPKRRKSMSPIETYEFRDCAQTPLSSKSDSFVKKRPQFLGELNASNFINFSPDSPRIDISSAQRTKSKSSNSSMRVLTKEKCTYVDRGCNTEEPIVETHMLKDELFIPIFEVVEDLIIHFADSAANTVFNSVLRSYQGDKFPPDRPTSWSGNRIMNNRDSGILSRPKTSYPRENRLFPRDNMMPKINGTSFSSQSINSKLPESNKVLPPTPAITPPKIKDPSVKTKAKVLTFSAANSRQLISAHNCFRRLLSSHLPAGASGYTQYYQTVPTSVDRIWKPVFGNWNVSECVLKKTTIDQIIALGFGISVENDFMSQITGMVERLGSKKSGQSRSDKIDVSYMISNAIQSLNPLTSNEHITDPQLKPSVIANLLVPQLESYFAYHASTKVLVLQFSAHHLPIIFALRDILGSSFLKIAGISAVSNTPLTQYPPSPVSPNPLLNDAIPSRNGNKTFMKYGNNYSPNLSSAAYSLPPSPSTVSNLEPEENFAGADYILSSIASNEDITRFISDIRQVLVEKSSFYLPEPEPEPRTIVQVIEKYISAPPVPVTRPSSQHRSSIIEGSVQDGTYKPNSRRQNSKSKRLSNNGIHTPLSEFIAKRNYAASIASSRRTYASSISELEGWENFDIGDESDFDEYDRMILGSKMSALMMGKKLYGGFGNQNEIIQQGVASKRKALKWLGLA